MTRRAPREGSIEWWLSAVAAFMFHVPSPTWPGQLDLATIERSEKNRWVVRKNGFLLDKKLNRFCLDRPTPASCYFRTKEAALRALKKWEGWAIKESKKREAERLERAT